MSDKDDSTPYVQITEVGSLIGKTIDRVATVGAIYLDGPTVIAFIFTDRTFAFIEMDSGYDGDRWMTFDGDPSHRDLEEMGLLTAEEVAAERNRVEAEKQQEAEREKARKFAEYQRLKAEFEGREERNGP